jgi:hypothetical protein
MTKLREPLSIDAALARIAGHVPGSWAAMAAEVSKTERTVRRWGDADDDAHINLPDAIRLDRLFNAHGGEGFPLHDVYERLLGVSVFSGGIGRHDVLRQLARVAKETGEAKAALAILALPEATGEDQRVAVRETLEALDALQHMMRLIQVEPGTTGAHNRGPPG